MLLRFLLNEIKRMILRPFPILLAGIIVAIGIFGIIQPNGQPNRIIAFWSVQKPFMLNLMVPVIAAIVSAGSLAWDRRTGYTQLILARGLSRQAYFYTKAFAMAIAASLVILSGYIVFYLLAIFLLPWGVSNPAGIVQNIQGYPGPVPPLFLTNPLLNDLLGIAMMVTATGALALVGVLAGVLIKNEYIATITPFAFFLGGGLLLGGSLAVYSPFTYTDVWGNYQLRLPLELLPYASFIYWLVLSAIILETASFFFKRKDLTD